MKQRIFMYLFIFAVLLVLFQYVNAKRIFEEQNKKIETYQQNLKSYKDSIVSLQHENLELSHFNLDFGYGDRAQNRSKRPPDGYK